MPLARSSARVQTGRPGPGPRSPGDSRRGSAGVLGVSERPALAVLPLLADAVGKEEAEAALGVVGVDAVGAGLVGVGAVPVDRRAPARRWASLPLAARPRRCRGEALGVVGGAGRAGSGSVAEAPPAVRGPAAHARDGPDVAAADVGERARRPARARRAAAAGVPRADRHAAAPARVAGLEAEARAIAVALAEAAPGPPRPPAARFPPAPCPTPTPTPVTPHHLSFLLPEVCRRRGDGGRVIVPCKP